MLQLMFEAKHKFFRLPLTDKQFLILGWTFVILGLAIGIAGLSFLFRQPNLGSVKTNNLTAVCPPAATQSAQLVVNIAGAVKKPGVYTLGLGSRLSQLVAEAGGFAIGADTFYVAKEINLALVLSDSDKFYIPSKSENLLNLEDASSAMVGVDALNSNSSKSGEAGLISVNQASQQDLESLSGIGEKRAEDIIASRPYQSLSELFEKQIISESLFDEIKSAIKL